MKIDWNTNLYCLIGNPIEKSLSPLIHNTIFELTNNNSIYLAFNVQEKDLKTTLEGFKSIGIKGFNVTVPHKKNIIKYLDYVSKEAEIIGAVNTVVNENGKLIGYNTDGEGFLKIFNEYNIDLVGKNILILGAGGAAFAIGSTLAMKDVKTITIANRNIENAKVLENKINNINKNIVTQSIIINSNDYNKEDIDIIINTTTLGMYPMEYLSPIELNGFSKDLIVYDIVYKPKETKLIKEAKAKGYIAVNGISMLLNQAILAQEIWLKDDKKINSKIIQNLEGILEDM